MLYEITYDYTDKHRNSFTNNLVGREGRKPVGYGPVGPGSAFRLEELPEVALVLREQLGTTPILHLWPQPWEE